MSPRYPDHRPNSPTPAAPLSKTRTTVALPPAVLPLTIPPLSALRTGPTVAALPLISAVLPRMSPPLLPAAVAGADAANAASAAGGVVAGAGAGADTEKDGEKEEDEEEDPAGSPVPAAPTK